MAKIKGRIIDRNRFTKKYSFVNTPKSPTYIGDKNLEMETVTVSFNNEEMKVVRFEAAFPKDDYQVALSSRQTTDSDSAAVGLYVDDDLSNARQVVVRATAPFTGEVDVIAIRITA
jgi:hypothetical protein